MKTNYISILLAKIDLGVRGLQNGVDMNVLSKYATCFDMKVIWQSSGLEPDFSDPIPNGEANSGFFACERSKGRLTTRTSLERQGEGILTTLFVENTNELIEEFIEKHPASHKKLLASFMYFVQRIQLCDADEDITAIRDTWLKSLIATNKVGKPDLDPFYKDLLKTMGCKALKAKQVELSDGNLIFQLKIERRFNTGELPAVLKSSFKSSIIQAKVSECKRKIMETFVHKDDDPTFVVGFHYLQDRVRNANPDENVIAIINAFQVYMLQFSVFDSKRVGAMTNIFTTN